MIERQKKLYLCRPSGAIMYQLNGVDTSSVEYDVRAKGYNEITFNVDRYISIDGELIESSGYEDLRVGMYILLEDTDLFVMQEPTLSNDGIHEYKTVKANSAECEFQDKDWVGLKVGTGTTDSLEYLAEGNIEINEFGFEMQKEKMKFYKSNNSTAQAKQLSMLHLILQKMPGWTVRDNDISHSLWNKEFKIEEDSINLYALLTSVIAPQVECIFLFDTINRRIKAIAKSELDATFLDTTIYISMRNLMQSVEVTTNEDSVYTVFNVVGGDNDELNVADVNYGDVYVYDLSYFMGEPWMNSTLVNKINAWLAWRDANREQYIDYSKQVNGKRLEIGEITYKLPNDAVTYGQWDVMQLQQLQENETMYKEQLLTLQMIADNASGSGYTPRTKPNGEIDHEYYENKLRDNDAGYWTYVQLYKYIIPNIETALYNKGKIQSERRDYVEEYETDWDLYGISELQNKEESYVRQLKTMQDYSKDWNDLTPSEKAKHETETNYNRTHNTFLEINAHLGSETTQGSLRYKLKQLRDQVDAINVEINNILNQQKTLINDSKITASRWGLTESELQIFNRLCKYTDYDNENIITTSLNDTVNTIDVEKTLYDDALSKLSEVSQPQYSFSVSLDNFLDISAFSSWKNKFELLRFMRVAIREDYTVKLRLIGYNTNPCEIDPQLTLEFSNFITSRSGRSDLTELLELSGASPSKNQITIGTGTSKDDVEYVTKLLQTMRNLGLLSSAIRSEATGVITAGSVYTSYVDTTKLRADFANIDYANINTLDVTELYATTGLITDLVSVEGRFTRFLDAVEVNANSITAGTLVTDRLLIRGAPKDGGGYEPGILYAINELTGALTGTRVDYDELNGGIVTKRTLNADRLIAHTITATEIATHSITADEITTQNIGGSNGYINFANGTFAYGPITTNYTQVASNAAYQSGASYFTKNSNNQYQKYDVNASTWANRPSPLYIRSYSDNINTVKLKWDGTTLTVRGDITATGGTISGPLVISGGYFTTNSQRTTYDDHSHAGITIDQNGIGGYGVVNNTSGYFNLTNTGRLSATQANISGTITATSGTIGGVTANSSYGLYTNSKTSATSTQSGFLISKDGSIYSGAYNSSKGSCPFQVTSAGALTANSATITGSITASGGSITGGLTIGSNGYFTTNASRTTYNSTSATGITITSSGIGGYGSANSYFTMTTGGKLTCTGADITGVVTATSGSFTGTITANSGRIGGPSGWIIDTNKIYSGTKDSGTAAGDVTLSNVDFTRTINNQSIQQLRFAIGGNFGVKKDGTLYANNANLSGFMTSINGTLTATLGSGQLTVIDEGTNSSATSIMSNVIQVSQGQNMSQIFPNYIESTGYIKGSYFQSGSSTYGANKIELYGSGSVDPYIDFHYARNDHNANLTDYTSRLVAVDDNTLRYQASGATYAKLQIYSGNQEVHYDLWNNTRHGAFIISGIGNFGLWDHSDGTAGAWVLRSDTSHNVYIPHTLYTQKLYITSADNNSNLPAIATGSGNNKVSIIRASTENNGRVILTMNIDNSSTFGDYYFNGSPTSDIRLKTNIKDTSVNNAIDYINQIKIREFDWTDGRKDTHQKIGFVADELEEIDPHLSEGGGYEEDGTMCVKSVDTFYLLGYLTKAFQELSAEVTSLRNEIKQLKSER